MGLLRVLPGQVLSVSNAQVPKASLTLLQHHNKLLISGSTHVPFPISASGCCHLSFCWVPLRRAWNNLLHLLLQLCKGCSQICHFSFSSPGWGVPNVPASLPRSASSHLSLHMFQLTSSSPAPGPQGMRQLHRIYAGTQLEESPGMWNGWWPHFRAIFSLLTGLAKAQPFRAGVGLQLPPHLTGSPGTKRWQISPTLGVRSTMRVWDSTAFMLLLTTTQGDSWGQRRGKAGQGKKQQQRSYMLQTENKAPGEVFGIPAAGMLLHPIGCCLPELHSNELGAASSHGISQLNPSCHPQSLPSSPCPAHPSIDPCPSPGSKEAGTWFNKSAATFWNLPIKSLLFLFRSS